MFETKLYLFINKLFGPAYLFTLVLVTVGTGIALGTRQYPHLKNTEGSSAIKQAVPMVMLRASCSNAQAIANRMSRASLTGANGNARMSANPFETESI